MTISKFNEASKNALTSAAASLSAQLTTYEGIPLVVTAIRITQLSDTGGMLTNNCPVSFVDQQGQDVLLDTLTMSSEVKCLQTNDKKRSVKEMVKFWSSVLGESETRAQACADIDRTGKFKEEDLEKDVSTLKDKNTDLDDANKELDGTNKNLENENKELEAGKGSSQAKLAAQDAQAALVAQAAQDAQATLTALAALAALAALTAQDAQNAQDALVAQAAQAAQTAQTAQTTLLIKNQDLTSTNKNLENQLATAGTETHSLRTELEELKLQLSTLNTRTTTGRLSFSNASQSESEESGGSASTTSTSSSSSSLLTLTKKTEGAAGGIGGGGAGKTTKVSEQYRLALANGSQTTRSKTPLKDWRTDPGIAGALKPVSDKDPQPRRSTSIERLAATPAQSFPQVKTPYSATVLTSGLGNNARLNRDEIVHTHGPIPTSAQKEEKEKSKGGDKDKTKEGDKK